MRLAAKNDLENNDDTSTSSTSPHKYSLRQRSKKVDNCQFIMTPLPKSASPINQRVKADVTSPVDSEETRRKAKARTKLRIKIKPAAKTGTAKKSRAAPKIATPKKTGTEKEVRTGAKLVKTPKSKGAAVQRVRTGAKLVRPAARSETRKNAGTEERPQKKVKGTGGKGGKNFIQVPFKVKEKMKKAYKCVPCGKIFRYKSLVIRHLFVHSGAKPIKCPDCPGQFSRQDLLNRHMQTHSGRKPYQCPNCMIWFLYRWQLAQHAQRHFGYKPFICAHCPKRFTTSGELRQHNFTHATVRPFKCNQEGCLKNYKDPRSLSRHIRRTHLIQE